MHYDFDQAVDRTASDSAKWHHYDEDVLPLWVADMDFRSPEPVIRALHERVEHGVFGYGFEPPALRSAIVERLERLYGWRVAPEAIVFMPGVVSAFNLACRAMTRPGEGVLVQTPVYPPILTAPANQGLAREETELTREADGSYTVDMNAFERAISGRTRVFLLCNPHNPVGRVFRRDELERMAEICLRHHVMICSDEIHCDLLFSGNRHIPIASLDPAIADQTVTLMAPSKTYNIAGLDCSVAIVENADMRARLRTARTGLLGGVNVLGYVAALAAYTEGQPWLDQVLCYLESNRDYLMDYVERKMPGITMGRPEGTYLAWLDCRQAGISGDPSQFFLEEARVGLNSGPAFGRGGEGVVRLNFACARSLLTEGLDRMREALERTERERDAH